MNEFKESLKVEREDSGKIIINDAQKNILIRLMKGEISKQQAMGSLDIGDKTTIELRIQEIVNEDSRLQSLYNEYIERKAVNFNGYSFRAEAIEMLRQDLSQTAMAEKIGIKRKSFSTKMKKLQEDNSDNILGNLLKSHAESKMKRQKTTPEELVNINLLLDEYESEFPVGISRYEDRNQNEVRLENIKRVIIVIDDLIESGMTLKDISSKGIISESSYRKYRAEMKNLTNILEGKEKKR